MDDDDRLPCEDDVPSLIPALLVASLSPGAADLLSSQQDPRYEAEASVLMARATSNLQTFGTSLVTAPSLDPSSYRAAALSTGRLAAALEATRTPNPAPEEIVCLRESIDVSVDDDRNRALFRFQDRADDPDGASALANEVAQQVVAWDQQRATTNLNQIIAALESQIAAPDQQSAGLRAAEVPDEDGLQGRIDLSAQQQEKLSYARTLVNSAVGLLDGLEPATQRNEPVKPSPPPSAELTFVLARFPVYGLILQWDALDTRLRDSEDLAKASGFPVGAGFRRPPSGSRRLPREASSNLHTNVLFATSDAHPRIPVVASPQQAEGKGSVALSLAEGFARNDHRTRLVGADPRKPAHAGAGRRAGLHA